jgi:ceramide glucosyltransferase
MIWLKTFCLVGIIFAAVYWLASLGCTLAFFMGRRRAGAKQADFFPAVTILVPMRGLDDDLERNLRALCGQDYPCFQIVLGVEEEVDPSAPVIRRIMAEFPEKDLVLVVCGKGNGANQKVNNLRAMLPHATHEILVLCDSDVRVGADYLQRVLAPLADETVGLVSCPYRWTHPRSLPAAIGSLTCCAEFIPSVLLVECTQGLRFALGATIAVRRRCLDEIGGFEAIQNCLADDYMLGKLVHEKGRRLVLSDCVVDLIHNDTAWSEIWQRQLRLARTYRACRPLGFFASVLTHGMSWATLFLCLERFSPLGWYVWLATAGLRLGCALMIQAVYCPDWRTTCFVWLLPVRDGLASLWWLFAYTGNRVIWRGRAFTLTRDGQLKPIPKALPSSS